MSRLAVILLAILFGTPAWSQTRPNTTAMSCAQAAGLVRSQGAIVLNTGPYTYDRFVSGGGFCAVTEGYETAWAPTADNPQCFVGYRCRSVAPGQSNR
ncbi:hypothetical protein [Microvirga lenta]|uniref:hypothetical protein n=1 Tax=Microvirga lenta TaxID=2881337 RepID=UPI001CFD9B11|nr:hypothetical protein [Microvirga lenta]MCB5173590.1 hypothetical protein [Microvirga lenta]